MTFKELNIIEPILKAIEEKGYNMPTPIQEKAIPVALAGKDVLGCAQTGTGKTASFAIPIIQLLQNSKEDAKRKGIKALILTRPGNSPCKSASVLTITPSIPVFVTGLCSGA